MGACQCRGKPDAHELGMGLRLKVAIVAIRGHLHAAEEESSEEQREERAEEQPEEKGKEERGRCCVVKAFGREDELYRTRAVEGACESVWKEEAEFDLAKAGGLEFSVWEDGTKFLGVAEVKRSTLEESFNGELRLEETFNGIEAYIKLKWAIDENEYPRLEPEYSVCLTKQRGAPLGVDLDPDDGVTVRLKSMDEGPTQILAYKVRSGDFIVRANRATGTSAKIMKELRAATSIALTIRRLEEFSVVLRRSDTRKPLGLDVLKKHAGDELIVMKVGKGAVQDWNSSSADRKICKGDRIVAVCGRRGAAAELQRELNSALEAELTVARPAGAESWQFA